MIFANVRAVFVRAFIIKSALLETGHVSRSQIVCLVSKRYTTISSKWFRPKAAGNIDLPEGPDDHIDRSDSCCDL